MTKPRTAWIDKSGSAKVTAQDDSSNLQTLSGLNITTLSGNQLVLADNVVTPKKLTNWSE